MIVTCEHCAARYKLDPGRITGRGVKITCPRCKNVFVVYRGEQGADTAEQDPTPRDEPGPTPAAPGARMAPTPAPAPSPAVAPAAAPSAAPSAAPAPATAPSPPRKGAAGRPDVESLDFSSAGIQAWKVKVRIGLVYDFSDYKTLARYIKDGRVGDDDQISHDGKTWTRLGDIADLEQHFVQVYLDAKAAQEAAAAPRPDGFDDDGPTMIVGASDVAKSLGDLARAKGPDDALAAATAAAVQAEDGAADGPVGPRFQDPFARSRAKQAADPAAARRKAAAAAPQPAAGGGRRMLAPAVVLALLVVAGGYGAWTMMKAQEATEKQDAEARRAAEAAATAARVEQAKEKQRTDVVQGIEKALTEVDAPPIAITDPEDEFVPVNPGARAVAQNTAGRQITVTDAGGAGGTMSTSAATPADHYSAGRTAYSAGRYPDAVTGFRAAVAGSPGSADYHYWLGLALDKTGSSEAMRALSQAAGMGMHDAYKRLGEISARQGDVAGAIGYYQQYLATNPSDAGAIQGEIDRLTH